MQTPWGKILACSLLTLVLLNIFHAFFLYEKKYEPITLSLTVETDFDTFTWFTVHPKYNDSIFKTETLPLFKDQPNTITTTIDQPSGLQFLGFYWSRSDKGAIAISDVTVLARGKTKRFDNLEKFVNYSSSNVTPVSTKKAITATSDQHANGWLMLELERFEKIAKTKQFKPLGWTVNILLFLVFCVVGWFYGRNVQSKYNHLKIEGNTIIKIRSYLFYLWMFLLPFWLIISHILLAVSLALVIVHFILEKESFQWRHLKNFTILFLLFFVILALNIIFHYETIGKDFGDYSYFLLAPFLFLGLERETMGKVFKVFQIGIVTYMLLLSMAILERYFQLPSNYSFSLFFFETVELYWHSSYLAGLALVALFFEFQQKKFSSLLLAVSLVAFVFLYLSQARLPLLIGLSLIIGLTILKLPKKWKQIYIGSGIVVVLLGGIFVYNSNEARARITKTFLVNDTQKVDARPELWKEALTISKENLISGVGSENVRDVLSKNLKNDSEIKYRRYNVHNQYLEFLMAYGILVPVLLLLVLATPIILGFKSTTVFVLYFSLAMLVESYFSRQAGVVIFSIFYCFFIFYDCKSEQHTAATSQ